MLFLLMMIDDDDIGKTTAFVDVGNDVQGLHGGIIASSLVSGPWSDGCDPSQPPSTRDAVLGQKQTVCYGKTYSHPQPQFPVCGLAAPAPSSAAEAVAHVGLRRPERATVVSSQGMLNTRSGQM